MADGERRLFSLTGIFQALLFISCVYFTLSSEIDPGYQIISDGDQVSYLQQVLVNRRGPKRERRAVDDATPTPSVGADSSTNGSGGQTLPDSPNQTGSATQSSPVNETGEGNMTMMTTTMQPTTVTAQNTTQSTTPENPFQEADIIHDHHEYYTTKAVEESGDSYFTDVTDAKKHVSLSSSHRVAAVISLQFKFPFYGHPVTSVTVATGGFIYMSPFLHQWLTATQYIAPLMANFDPSFSKDSDIVYLSEEEMFTVEWSRVHLKDQKELGDFTFQTTLYSNGSIRFVYKDIPVHVSKISDKEHPVKIGLSDAYYNDTYIREFRIRRRVIYEYHQVTLKEGLVKSGAVIFVNPLPTCNLLTDCESCTRHVGVNFNCNWCNYIGRCSDGLDWYRQHWDKYGCKQLGLDETNECAGLPPPAKHIVDPIPMEKPSKKKCADGSCGDGGSTSIAVIVVVVVLILTLVCGVAGWVYYAYTHPTSRSGMWLMEHRPSQIRAKIKFWKNGSSSENGAKYRAEAEA